MQIDDTTVRWLVGGLIAIAVSSIVNSFKSGRSAAKYEKGLEDVGALNDAVFGDNKKNPPVVGLVTSREQDRLVMAAISTKVAGMQDGLDAHGSKEHKIAAGVRKGIAAIAQETINETTGSNQRVDTGQHRAIGWPSGMGEQLPPPAQLLRRPTPHHLPIVREEPESDPPPPPRRRRGDGGE